MAANTQELAKDKWLCPISGKKFKGPEFVRKHIFNKQGDKASTLLLSSTYALHCLNVSFYSFCKSSDKAVLTRIYMLPANIVIFPDIYIIKVYLLDNSRSMR